jgi:hypothetical protein
MSDVKISTHEGKKYLRLIRSADRDRPGTAWVDVYAVLVAFGVTDPGMQQAVKKLLCAGGRGKGDVIADLYGAIAAIKRSIEIAEDDKRDAEEKSKQWQECYERVGTSTQPPQTTTTPDPSLTPIGWHSDYVLDQKEISVPREAHTFADFGMIVPLVEETEAKWVVITNMDDDGVTPIGYSVGWSMPTKRGWFKVQHYIAGDAHSEGPSLAWCQNAAERIAAKMNEDGVHPSRYQEWRP